jgi:hypothetical protein
MLLDQSRVSGGFTSSRQWNRGVLEATASKKRRDISEDEPADPVSPSISPNRHTKH